MVNVNIQDCLIKIPPNKILPHESLFIMELFFLKCVRVESSFQLLACRGVCEHFEAGAMDSFKTPHSVLTIRKHYETT